MIEAIEQGHEILYDALIKFKNESKSTREIKEGLKMAIKAVNDSQIEEAFKDTIIRVFICETRKVFPEIEIPDRSEENA